MHTTGIDLRVDRVKARLSVQDIARETGWSRSWISQIELRDRVPADTAGRYREALRKLTNGTENVA